VDQSFSIRRFGWAVAVLAAVIGVGTIGFHEVTTESWIASFYRSVVTTTLTGIDSRPPGDAAQLFTIAQLVAGVAIFAYVAGTIVELIARGVLEGAWAERRRRHVIERLRDHYIICGYGRVGSRVAEEFRAAGVEFVVLDFTEEALELAREHGDHYVEGSGTSDDDLEAAGLARARGLLVSSDSDVDNLYIVLSARAARPDLQIVARASSQDVARKLERAGADRVVQPYTTAGEEMAKLMLKPQVTAFLEMVTTHGGPELSFEEIEVTASCPQAGRTIRELRVRAETGALIVALRKGDGTFDTTPDPDALLEAGDVMIAMGTDRELRALEELFAPREAVAG
jgi:voltage-gated potassium channel